MIPHFLFLKHLFLLKKPPRQTKLKKTLALQNEKSILAVWNSSDASVEWTFESAGGAVLCRLAPQEYTVIPDTPVYSVSSIKNT